ncbi:family 16 glycosylhydrolase [Pseudocolwellia agarivorans]|uniref:family 16 glycosylhydrolase n=1 Tax=Pseudocolwellia agarivorans TaxID=1911682 RepID=UPI000984A0C4|nr:family 16 glycosylhydrolase [Pseudocolwellia agarivorans]
MLLINNKYSLLLLFVSILSGCGSSRDNPDTIVKKDPPVIENPAEPSVDNKNIPHLANVNADEWEYVEVLSDEFDGGSIDSTKWDHDLADWGPWSWEPENTTQQNGKLSIAMTYEEHTAQRRAWNNNGELIDVDMYYKSGILRSKTYQSYGYYEARIKGSPTFPGHSPAFWIYSINSDLVAEGLAPTKEGDVGYSEVDIVEMQQSNWIPGTNEQYFGPELLDMNLHTRVIENGKLAWKRPGGFPELTKNEVHVDFDPRDDFHIYGAKVDENYVTWYLDGEQVAQKPNVYWHLPMRVTLSLGLRRPHVTYNCSGAFQGLDRCPVPENATAEGYPSAMEVDWVRVFKKKP